jgi:hypothetical protein|tara:strand:- start:113 stop:469 length:357 start_codon:yes stop_codon:yes gene_type:complete
MRHWKPLFFENSKLPVWLSKLAPIEIGALSFAFFVWGRKELSERTKRHETIHYQQQLELLFVGQWLLYGIFWLQGYVKYRNGKKAYYRCPFEREAYENQYDKNYFEKRIRYNWRKYKI